MGTRKEMAGNNRQSLGSGVMACSVAKRLYQERRKSFWQTGAFRQGNPDQRRAWVLQRYNEQYPLKLVNPYL